MKTEIKKILHEINRYRDQINSCYECIAHDFREGEAPQQDDFQELESASLKLAALTKALMREKKEEVYYEFER